MGLPLPVCEDFAGLELYGTPQLDMPVRLNVSENPHAPSSKVITDITRSVVKAAPTLNRYPDRGFTELCYTLADYLEVESGVRHASKFIWVANGSNEVMTQILQAFGGPGRTFVSSAPAHSMYHEYVRDTNATQVQGRRLDDFPPDLDAVARVFIRGRPAVLVLASPNNPTGTALSQEQQRAIIEMTRESGPVINGYPGATPVAIDEAYREFRREGVPSALELPEDAPHLVVTRTMSKTFGVTGPRLGHISAAHEIIDVIMLVRLLYHPSTLTQATAPAVLRYKDFLMTQVGALRERCDGLVDWLHTHGFHALDSDAGSILFGTLGDHIAIFEALLTRGVLIRVVGPEEQLYVSVSIPEEACLFTTALEEIIQ